MNIQRIVSKIGDIDTELKIMQVNRNKVARYGFWNGEKTIYFHNKKQGNDLIRDLLLQSGATMVARHGHVELVAAAGYDFNNVVPNMENLHLNAGVFPDTQEIGQRWAELYLESLKQVDCLCEWNFRFGRFVEAENLFGKYSPHAKVINVLGVLTPFFEENPWTLALAGKRVLVIHPFKKSIENQYPSRDRIFDKNKILPEFKSLQVISAVQTIAGNKDDRFDTWFDAMAWMCNEITRADFDVALIGAGAYGLPLASHVKKLGKKAVHVGGALQLLFGIKGSRWENEAGYRLEEIMNEHWIKPLPEECPSNAKTIEGGCYW
jgi:hypothetical protein